MVPHKKNAFVGLRQMPIKNVDLALARNTTKLLETERKNTNHVMVCYGRVCVATETKSFDEWDC